MICESICDFIGIKFNDSFLIKTLSMQIPLDGLSLEGLVMLIKPGTNNSIMLIYINIEVAGYKMVFIGFMRI